ncbi:hypothetical protein CAPI_01645 [Corynebacterium capitovis DSM 44611]|uniref:type VII secretion-associated protein n=1 Tax=Corynebacterium capitovis TaxID=131081 RepID=UPI00035C7677|nr:type VII secretion-associated protein [Corynebacterium capitovis]WKD56903.1 hypothetical protein CAPI_01645 [Corynebacterium capitovis DSM 44611]
MTLSPARPEPHVEPSVTVTITESSTIFTGLANLYRYDRPSPAEVAAYVRSVIGPDPRGAVVHVIAAAEDVDKLDQALGDYEVTLTAEHPSEQDPDIGEWEVPIQRPASPPRERERGVWLLATVAAVVLAVAAGAIWAAVSRGPIDFGAQEVADVETSTSEAPPPTDAPTATLTRDGLSVELPAGFRLEPDGDMWRATGADPDFRLQIAVADLYGLPASEMVEQVLREIESDPEVELVESAPTLVRYRETQEDGSEALWTTWSAGGKQLFVGCHTRRAPTTVQNATCRMALDSAVYTPAG